MGTFNKLKEVQEKRESTKKQEQPVSSLRSSPSATSTPSLAEHKHNRQYSRPTTKTDNLSRYYSEHPVSVVSTTKQSNLGKPFILYAIRTSQYARQKWLIVFTIFVLAFNVKLLLMSWDSSKQSDKAFMQLAAVRSAVDSTSRKVSDLAVSTKAVTEDMERIASKVDNTNNKVKKLENTSDAQQAAIETLGKSKNAVLNRLNDLEAAIEKLKKEKTFMSQNS